MILLLYFPEGGVQTFLGEVSILSLFMVSRVLSFRYTHFLKSILFSDPCAFCVLKLIWTSFLREGGVVWFGEEAYSACGFRIVNVDCLMNNTHSLFFILGNIKEEI